MMMSHENKKFIKPGCWTNAEGHERKAGFELEFSGINIEDCVVLLTSLFEGEPQWINQSKVEIKTSTIGDIGVELDFSLLHKTSDLLESKIPKFLGEGENVENFFKNISGLMGKAVADIVPLEISTAPLTFDLFDRLEHLREKLRVKKAKGTKKSTVNAFGLHLNPEVPSQSSSSILSYIRAFIIIYPWLKKNLKVDFTRRFLSFINFFPLEYQKKATELSYNPNMNELIEDYLQLNSTRNRALDLLPLFAHIDSGIIKKLPEQEQQLIKPRPAFHYRLPNCNVDDSHWRIAYEWNAWCLVENLASNSEKLENLCEKYQKHLDQPIEKVFEDWKNTVEKYLT